MYSSNTINSNTTIWKHVVELDLELKNFMDYIE